MKLTAPLLALTTFLAPTLAFACGNTMFYHYAPSAVDYIALSPIIAGLLVLILRRVDKSTVPRELALITTSYIGALGVGLLLADRFYSVEYWIVGAALVTIPLLLSVPLYAKRPRIWPAVLGGCTIFAGACLTLLWV